MSKVRRLRLNRSTIYSYAWGWLFEVFERLVIVCRIIASVFTLMRSWCEMESINWTVYHSLLCLSLLWFLTRVGVVDVISGGLVGSGVSRLRYYFGVLVNVFVLVTSVGVCFVTT